jgi:hypothetical protein
MSTIRKPASNRKYGPHASRPRTARAARRAVQPIRQEQLNRPTASNPTRPRSSAVNLSNGLHLINEALSRARMRQPQDTGSEAYRSARQIAMRSRREQNRLLGL